MPHFGNLTSFVTAREQNDNRPAMLAEIHAIAGADMDAKFADAFPNRLDIAEITRFNLP